jgi:hypothetical protein
MGDYQTIHYEVEAFQVDLDDSTALAALAAWCSGWISEGLVLFHGSDGVIGAGPTSWVIKLPDGSFTLTTPAQFTAIYEEIPA